MVRLSLVDSGNVAHRLLGDPARPRPSCTDRRDRFRLRLEIPEIPVRLGGMSILTSTFHTVANLVIESTAFHYFTGLCELYAAYAMLYTSITAASLRDVLLHAYHILSRHADLLSPSSSSRRMVVLGCLSPLDRGTLLPFHMVAKH